jgi:hypothetical protein
VTPGRTSSGVDRPGFLALDPGLTPVEGGENLGAHGECRLGRGAGAEVQSDRAVDASDVGLVEAGLGQGLGAAGVSAL